MKAHKYYVFRADPTLQELEPFLADISNDWSIVHVSTLNNYVHYLLRQDGPWEDRGLAAEEQRKLAERQVKAQEKLADTIGDHNHP